jgi:pyruvate formate lyase activating enzyme
MSLIDYPDNVCLTVFTGGCNYRCPFCHNANLVLAPEKTATIPLDSALSEIERRKKLIDGITITGGEPLMHNDIRELIEPVKRMGLKVKLDTNGAFFDLLSQLLSENLLDYVAMDIKSSKKKYAEASGANADIGVIERSAELLRASKIDYEFRTTAVPGLVEEEDVGAIGEWLKGSKRYCLQQFVPEGSLDLKFRTLKPHPEKKLEEFAKIAGRYFLNVEVRGI